MQPRRAGSKAATLSGSFTPRAKIVSPEAHEPHQREPPTIDNRPCRAWLVEAPHRPRASARPRDGEATAAGARKCRHEPRRRIGRGGAAKTSHEPRPRRPTWSAEFVRAVRHRDPGRGRGGTLRAADLSGSDQRARFPRRLQLGQTVRAAADGHRRAAVSADGVRARGRDAGRLWHRRLGRGRGQAPAAPSVSCRAQSLAQGLQRGRLAAGHRDADSLFGKRVPRVRWRHRLPGPG